MKIKRKIMAIGIAMLFVAISISHAEAGNSSNNVENEPILLEFGSIAPDGTFSTDTLFISEEDLAELEEAVSVIMNNIESTNNFDWGSLRELLEKIFGREGILFGRLLEIFSKFKLSKTRGFVVSSGHGRDLSIRDSFSFNIRKNIAIWHYNSRKLFNDRTIIVKPFALKLKILKGRQVGIMRNFFGLYFSVSRGFLRDSYTFFMGTARHINGFEVFPRLNT